MKCARFTEFAGPIEIADVPEPSVPADGVIIQVEAAGLCRSDWHAWQGHDPDIKFLPHIPGHEFSGTIAAVGKDVTQWKLGDRVTAPFACGCGTCQQCTTGHAQVCPDQYQPGFSGPGAFAELVALPHADHNLVGLPDAIDSTTAASLGCRFATAFRALAHPDQANLQAGESVAVFGCGGVGLSAIMIAAALRAEVIAIDIRPEALDAAKNYGATHTIAGDPADTLRDLTHGRGVDVTIDALGHPDLCRSAIQSLAPRGRHLQIGLLLGKHAHPPLPMGPIIAKELRLIGSHGMAANHYPAMLAMIASGNLQPQSLITQSIPLTQIPTAMTAMSTHSGQAGITIVDKLGA